MSATQATAIQQRGHFESGGIGRSGADAPVGEPGLPPVTASSGPRRLPF